MAECLQKVEGGEVEEETRVACLQAYSLVLGMLPSLITRAACELDIPDLLLIEPLSALQLAQQLTYPSHPPPPLQETTDYLERIMRFLCAHGVFKAHVDASGDSRSADPVKYCLTPLSRWLLKPDGEGCPAVVADHPAPTNAAGHIAGFVQGERCSNHAGNVKATCPEATSDACPSIIASSHSLRDFLMLQTCAAVNPPWQHVSEFILKGGEGPFFKAYGIDGWTFLNSNPQFALLFNRAMSCDSDLSIDILLKNYHGFDDVHTLVDVGGGIGTSASRIVAKYPTIKAITLDLPRVIANAPSYPGVELVGGDMFEQIPEGDAIFIKWVFHNWDDEKCIKILKNCRKVLPKNGKVVIMDAVLAKTFNHEQSFNNLRTSMDMLMLTTTLGGKERTMQQWEYLFERAEFTQFKVMELPCLQCIIEAFPTFDHKNQA